MFAALSTCLQYSLAAMSRDIPNHVELQQDPRCCCE